MASSAYFGLTNSGINPFVLSKAFKYISNWKIKTFVLPGKSLIPSLFGTSPLGLYFSFNKASNWLYSTLFVIELPSFLVNLQIAPTASPGFLGIQIVFIAKPNFTLVPIAEGILLKIKALVSWNKTKYFFPSDTHFLTKPFWYIKR